MNPTDVMGMTMADAAHADARDEIDVAVSVRVRDNRVLSLG